MAILYVIRSPLGRRKVGQTTDLRRRLATLLHANALGEYGQEFVCEFFIECGDGRVDALEAHIHASLWHRRVKGEWFWCDLDTAREAIFAAQLAAEIGALMPRPETIARPGLWQGEGRFEWSKVSPEEDALQTAERQRFKSQRMSEAGKARWARRRAAQENA